MELVSKAKMKDPEKVVRDTWGEEDFPELFDYAARLMMLQELDRHGSELEREAKKAARDGVKKYQRAVIKTYLKTGDERALDLMEVIKHRPGGKDHDQKDHGKWAHEGAATQTPGVTGVGQDVFNFASLVKLPDKLAGGIAHVADHMADFLGSNNWGRKVLAAGEFLGGKAGVGPGSKLRLAAELAGKYGQPTREALWNTYFRFKGHDVAVDLPNKSSEGKEGARNRVIDALSKRLPSDSAASRSRSAGSFPPSEGYIIDREGNIVARGVGTGEDHYTPFDIRHFGKGQGGSLVRRRVWGGPTTEDLHAAMVMGARDLTVVSRNGTFTLGLTDMARKNKGVHLAHPRIVDRYDKLYNAGSRNGSGVRDALEGLASEFPLHFTFNRDDHTNINTRNEGEHDRRRRKKVFGGLLGRDEDDRPSGGSSQQRATPVPPPGGGGSLLQQSGRMRSSSEEGRQARQAAERYSGMGTSQRAYNPPDPGALDFMRHNNILGDDEIADIETQDQVEVIMENYYEDIMGS